MHTSKHGTFSSRPRGDWCDALLIARQSGTKTGGLAKGVSAESSVAPKKPTKPKDMGPAVHFALRAPQAREAYIFAKNPSKNPLFSGSQTIQIP